jgi:hypothetical protein
MERQQKAERQRFKDRGRRTLEDCKQRVNDKKHDRKNG